MPGRICTPVAKVASRGARTVSHAAIKPLGLVSSSYQKWRDERGQRRLAEEQRRRIAIDASAQLEEFHDAIWNEWPAHVAKIRAQRSQEDFDE